MMLLLLASCREKCTLFCYRSCSSDCTADHISRYWKIYCDGEKGLSTTSQNYCEQSGSRTRCNGSGVVTSPGGRQYPYTATFIADPAVVAVEGLGSCDIPYDSPVECRGDCQAVQKGPEDGGPGSGNVICSPNARRPCACPNAAPGVEICNGTGTSWGVCQC